MEIVNLIQKLPWHSERRWKMRDPGQISKIIIHQELANGSVEAVNNYHITPGPDNHISEKGAPHFCYHYSIRLSKKEGEVVQANELSQVTWHTRNHNLSAVGIMLEGCFNGIGFDLGDEGPTKTQMDSLENLVDYLIDALGLTPWGG